MATDMTIHMPVPRYVLKYCHKLYGGSNWRLSTRTKESKVLYAMLERAPDRYEKERKDQCKMHVLIPAKIVKEKGCHLSNESIELFIDYIKQVIMDEILQFHTGIHYRIGLKAIDRVAVNQYMAEKKVRLMRIRPDEAHKFFWQKSMIYDILQKYDITEDEITYDSAVKHLQRHSPAQYSA